MNIQNINNINFEDLKYTSHVWISDLESSIEDIEELLERCPDQLRSVDIKNEIIERIPKNLGIFPKLESVHFQIKKLQTLDLGLLPKTISSLYIECPSFKGFEKNNMQSLNHLRQLIISAPIDTLPDIEYFPQLTSLSLSKTLVETIDKGYFQKHQMDGIFLGDNLKLWSVDVSSLKILRHLQILNNHELLSVMGIGDCSLLENLTLSKVDQLSDDLQYCSNLIYFSIDTCNTDTIPSWFFNLNKLQSLSISYSKITDLPVALLGLTKLRNLAISNSSLKYLPSNWQSMKALENINLWSNQIEDFSFLYTIPNLKYSNISNNPMRDGFFPLEFSKTIPITGLSCISDFRALNYKETPLFLSALAKSGLERLDKEWFYYQFKDKQSLSIPLDWTLYRLMQAIMIQHKILIANATRRLEQLDINEAAHTMFKQGAVCYLAGNFTQNKTEIKEKLTALGIKTTTNISDETSHIIIGNRAKEIVDIYKEKEILFLFEHQFYPFIKNVGAEDKFLVQEETTGEATMTEGVKQLLGSEEAVSVQLGLQMLKTGGIPEGVMEELIMLQKTFKDSSVRNEAKKILETHVSVEWAGILKDKQNFVDLAHTKEKEIRDKFEKMSKTVDKNHIHELGKLFFKYHKKGLSFSLQQFMQGTPQRLEVLELLTTDSYFNFHQGIGYQNWKNKAPETVILSVVSTGIAFPSDHPNPLAIKTINMHNCKFDTLSKDVALFGNLEELDLSVNNLKTLPPQLSKLQNLRHLNLSLNRLTKFPTVLENLPCLETLDLRYNDSNAFKSEATIKIEIPTSFYEKLPKCRVLF